MDKDEKEKTKRKPAPVITGRDERAEKREDRSGSFIQPSAAPDGVSGNWS